jgi:hypothetical protein
VKQVAFFGTLDQIERSKSPIGEFPIEPSMGGDLIPLISGLPSLIAVLFFLFLFLFSFFFPGKILGALNATIFILVPET